MALGTLWVTFNHLLEQTGAQTGPAKVSVSLVLGRRFKLLKSDLEGQRRVWFIIEPTRLYGENQLDVMIAQYTLAPVVIDHQQDQPTAITNFDSDHRLRRWLAGSDYSLQSHVAPGLAIVERTGP